jgi:hypothetical protein
MLPYADVPGLDVENFWRIFQPFFRLPPCLSHPLWHDSRMSHAPFPTTGLHPAINALLANPSEPRLMRRRSYQVE